MSTELSDNRLGISDVFGSASLAARLLWRQGELPRAVEVIGMWVGRADQAARADTRVDGPGEFGVLDLSHCFAGEGGQATPLPRRLHPTVVHAQHQCLGIDPDHFLLRLLYTSDAADA